MYVYLSRSLKIPPETLIKAMKLFESNPNHSLMSSVLILLECQVNNFHQ